MMDVKCGRCGRKIKNLATAHKCGDTWYGPSCSKKMEFFSPDEPEVKGHNLEHREKFGEFARKAGEKNPLLEVTPDETEVQAEIRIEKIAEMFQEQYQDIYIDSHSHDNIFTRPVHPSYLKKVDGENMVFFHRAHTPEMSENAPKNVVMDKEQNGIRAVHCFGKMFEDPSLSSRALKTYRSLKLQFAGFMPVSAHPKDKEFASLVVTSNDEKSHWERYMCLTVKEDKVNVQLLVLSGKKMEALASGDIRTVKLWERATDPMTAFDETLAKIMFLWFTEDKPLKNDVLVGWQPKLALADHDSRFKHLK